LERYKQLRIWAKVQNLLFRNKKGQKFDSSIVFLQNDNDFNSIYLAFEQLFKNGHHSLVDQMFSRFDIPSLTQTAMIALLDATIFQKNNLKKRQEFYDKCKDELDNRKEKRTRRFDRLA
jgi:hypothetical protein